MKIEILEPITWAEFERQLAQEKADAKARFEQGKPGRYFKVVEDMKPVIIESPSAHIEYAYKCALDCLDKGEAPFASHILYTLFLDDENPDERALGIRAGFAWWQHAEAVIFYTDHGWTEGMLAALDRCKAEGKPIIVRSLTLPALPQEPAPSTPDTHSE